MNNPPENITYSVLYVNEEVGNTTTPKKIAPMVSLKVPAIMFAAGVLGNMLALIVLSRSRKEHKRTVFYRLVGGLAITDLFGTLATSPVTLVNYANNLRWVGGQSLCDYFSFMLIFFGFATVFIVCSMALDRYVALRKPYLYEAKITYHKGKYILLTLWFAAFLIACLPLIGLGGNVKHYPGSWCFFDFYSDVIRVKVFAYLYSIIGISVISTIIILNTILIITVWKMRQVTILHNKYNHTKRLDSEIQMVIFLVGILMVFGLCWGPLMFRVLIIQLTGMTKDTEKDDLVVIRFASFNQILDPWVYLLFRRELFCRFYSFIKKLVCPKQKELKSPSRMLKKQQTFTSTFNTENLITIEFLDSSNGRNSPENTTRDASKLVEEAPCNHNSQSSSQNHEDRTLVGKIYS